MGSATTNKFHLQTVSFLVGTGSREPNRNRDRRKRHALIRRSTAMSWSDGSPPDVPADRLPQLRAWTKTEAERGREMNDVAFELSVRWGVSAIPLRKLLREAFNVDLGTANEACRSIGSARVRHPLSALANAQLNESWMRDMAAPGTPVVLDFHDVHGWSLSMTRGSQTLVTSLGLFASVSEALIAADTYLLRIRSDSAVVWATPTDGPRHVVGSFTTKGTSG
jgi:hypothetical protein